MWNLIINVGSFSKLKWKLLKLHCVPIIFRQRQHHSERQRGDVRETARFSQTPQICQRSDSAGIEDVGTDCSASLHLIVHRDLRLLTDAFPCRRTGPNALSEPAGVPNRSRLCLLARRDIARCCERSTRGSSWQHEVVQVRPKDSEIDSHHAGQVPKKNRHQRFVFQRQSGNFHFGEFSISEMREGNADSFSISGDSNCRLLHDTVENVFVNERSMKFNFPAPDGSRSEHHKLSLAVVVVNLSQ